MGVLRFGRAVLVVAAATLAADAADNVQLTVQKDVAPGDVRLNWTGGTPTYSVYRSTDKTAVVTAANKLGDTAAVTWLDTPPAGTLFVYRIVGPCQTPTPEVCDGVDDDCNGFVDNGCPGTCVNDAGCSPSQFCDAAGFCVSDVFDGDSCSRDGQCVNAHCSQGVCCQGGDCCTSAAQCAAYATPPVCNSPSTCQGTRTDGICQSFSCASQVVDDDSGCAGQVSNTCGFYPSIQCTSAVTQPGNQAALCATSCNGDAFCDASAHCTDVDEGVCLDDVSNGGGCGTSHDCESSLCVDFTCCNDACAGTCRACDVFGSLGSCTNVPNGQDIDAECGGQTCTGFYNGFVGSTCFRKADVSAAQANCNGAGACRTQAQECSLSGQGPGTLTCHSTCQQPTAGTCTGTTAGSCTNVNPGNSSCGLGACQVTVPTCTNGAPNTCTPGNPTVETCNGIDDNCNGTVDDGAFTDAREPNNSCGAVSFLSNVGSDQTQTLNNLTVYGSGDFDHYFFNANETDSICGCGFSVDEDYDLKITLTVPSNAGSYELCSNVGSCAFSSCVTIPAGSSQTQTWFLDGSCTASDSYQAYVRVRGIGAPAFSCAPYTLSYQFVSGLCR